MRAKTKRNRSRRVQLTLRSMGFVVLTCSIAFAWFAWQSKLNRERISTIRELHAKGVKFHFDQLGYPEVESDRFDVHNSMARIRIGNDRNADPFASVRTNTFGSKDTFFAKLCRLLGEEPPIVVHGIEFRKLPDGATYSDEDIELLRRFPEATSVLVTTDRITEQNLAAIKCLSNLRELTLGCEQLPNTNAAFGHASNLQTLQLRDTKLGKNAIRSISRLSKLKYLELLGVKISASRESLSELQRLSELTNLFIATVNHDAWSNLPVLPQVRQLTVGPVCTGERRVVSLQCLQQFPNLESLSVSHIGGPGCDNVVIHEDEFENLCHTPQLKKLNLASSAIGDKALEHVCRQVQLQDLDITQTKVTDAGMSYFGAMESLKHLDIRFTKIGDEGLRQLWGLPNLSVLEIAHSAITQSARDEFFQDHPECTDGTILMDRSLEFP